MTRMTKSASKKGHRHKLFALKNPMASRLRQRKFRLIRQFGFPENLLTGSLSLTYRRCGKPTCHCAEDEGHPMWTLTYSVKGKKQVEIIPQTLVATLKPLVREGRKHREGLAELLSLNAQLLRLWLKQERAKHRSENKASKRSKKLLKK